LPFLNPGPARENDGLAAFLDIHLLTGYYGFLLACVQQPGARIAASAAMMVNIPLRFISYRSCGASCRRCNSTSVSYRYVLRSGVASIPSP